MKIKSIKPITIILLALTLVWCAVIFRFSSRSAAESTKDSDDVIEVITVVVKKLFNSDVAPSSFLVRKAGHMTEFGILGILASLTLLSVSGSFSKLKLLYSVVFCVCIASLDELSQFMSPGRSPQFTDVAIDTSGALIGILLVMFASAFYIRHLNKRVRG